MACFGWSYTGGHLVPEKKLRKKHTTLFDVLSINLKMGNSPMFNGCLGVYLISRHSCLVIK